MDLSRILLFLVQLPVYITAVSYTYTFQEHCDGYAVHEIDEDDTVHISHNGESLPGSYCSAGFVGRESRDMYRICVYIHSFHFEDCGLQLDVSEETDYYKRSYSCGDEVPEGYCTGVEKTLHLVLRGINKGNNTVSLQVVALKTYNHSRKIAVIAGLCGLAVIVVSTAVMIGVVIQRRRRNRPIKWVGKKKAFKLLYIRSAAKVIYGREKPRKKGKPGVDEEQKEKIEINT